MTVATRLGSLNSFDFCRRASWLRKWIGGVAPSGDTVGRVLESVRLDPIREILAGVYDRLKRNKALRPLPGGVFLLVFDGHEGRHSIRRKWTGCLSRTAETGKGTQIEYFPRYVAAQLVGEGCSLVMDLEMQKPEEGELAAAERLLLRLLKRFPRAFDIVMGDALYASSPFWKIARAAGKDVLTVLKQEDRAVLKDARSLFDSIPEPESRPFRRGQAKYWDVPDLRSWSQVGEPVRVVRSQETRTIVRQIDSVATSETNEWVWVTSIPQARADAARVARLGHERWRIENNAFNELVNEWHADHLFRCHTNAIEAFLLLTCTALNIFNVFMRRNLKPSLRARVTAAHVAAVIRGNLLAAALGNDTS